MKLNVKGMTLAFGLIWGGAMLFTGVAHVIGGGYGQAFLDVMASIYPGFHGAGTFGDAIVGTLYGVVDGATGGAVFAWLYNLLSM
jgi:hypothetical protein